MNIYEIVTNSLIERVERMIANGETANWLCPWQRSGLPKSYITEKTYSGINLWLLESGYFLTYYLGESTVDTISLLYFYYNTFYIILQEVH